MATTSQTFTCQKCGHSFDMDESEAKYTRWDRCKKCGGRAIKESAFSASLAGNAWRQTGGLAPEAVRSQKAVGSLARALPTDMVQQQMDLDKSRGVSAKWVNDGRGMARPVFDSLEHRRKWDRAQPDGFYDADGN